MQRWESNQVAPVLVHRRTYPLALPEKLWRVSNSVTTCTDQSDASGKVEDAPSPSSPCHPPTRNIIHSLGLCSCYFERVTPPAHDLLIIRIRLHSGARFASVHCTASASTTRRRPQRQTGPRPNTNHIMARLNARPSSITPSRLPTQAMHSEESDQENHDPSSRAILKGKARVIDPTPSRASLPTPTSDSSNGTRGQKRKRSHAPAATQELDDDEEKFRRFYDPDQNLDIRREIKRKTRALEREFAGRCIHTPALERSFADQRQRIVTICCVATEAVLLKQSIVRIASTKTLSKLPMLP